MDVKQAPNLFFVYFSYSLSYSSPRNVAEMTESEVGFYNCSIKYLEDLALLLKPSQSSQLSR